MNAVVAIGGAPLLRAVSAYRALVPSAVWVLGLKTPRDPNDQLLRSLELLLEPFMQRYFEVEARTQVAAMSAELTKILLPARDADPNRVVNAVSEAMWKDVAATLALIAMLDRAHGIQAVELVLDDDSSALARTAVAWARARGVPSVTLPARVPLGRPRKPCADKTIVIGERVRRAYRAIDVDESLCVNLSPHGPSYETGTDERAARRIAGKAALTRALGWLESDVVVIFEPAEGARRSALDPANAVGESLNAVFRAFVLARAGVPSLRLVVLGSALQDNSNLAGQTAANAGLAAGDYAYGDADYDIWIAASDIMVSVNSPLSIDAAAAGVPAINLWQPENWYQGSSFAAEDGIVDVPPSLLGATLVALATDATLRTQIAAIAGDRLGSALATGAQFASVLGAELVQHRRLPRRKRLPYGDAGERAASRTSAKAALTKALRWHESDFIFVFEPADAARRSAADAADASDRALAAVFAALRITRERAPHIRLVVIAAPSREGHKLMLEAAASAGLSATDFVYGDTDHDIWIAAADAVIFVESTRSKDAALTGVPAINLRGPVHWARGALSPLEDGVLDLPLTLLDEALIAFARDNTRHAQELVLTEDQNPCTVPKPSNSPISAGGPRLADQSRSAVIIAPHTKPDIVICAPAYQHASAGLRALYRLCHFINLAGGNASIFPGDHVHPSWNTPRRDTNLTDHTIVVYPEIYYQSLPAKRVVRWVLNEPGLLGGPKRYDDDEMVFYYHQTYRAAAQAATAETLTNLRELQIAVIEPELFYNDRSRARTYDCVFVYKGQALFDRVQNREIRDAYVINSGWPTSRKETAQLLRGCRRLYSFDGSSAIVTEGIICGAEVYMMRNDGLALYTGTEGFNVQGYERRYYDLSPVRQFLRLVYERWGD